MNANPCSVTGEQLPIRCQSMRSVSAMIIVALVLVLGAPGVALAQTVSNVYNFTGQSGAANPFYGTLAQGRDGTLYGTTYQLSGGDGSVFKVTTKGAGGSLFAFSGTNGLNPFGGVTLAGDGSFYGTTGYGGNSAGDGVLFKITPKGLFSVLHEFGDGVDGLLPVAAPIQASDGNLYGTTFGSPGTGATVYKYTRSTGVLTTLYQFDQTHGQFIFAPLIQATDGNLYGTASNGGANGCGTVFKMNTLAHCSRTIALLVERAAAAP